MSFGKFFKDALLPVAVWTCGVLLSCFVLTVAGAPVSIVVVAVGVSFIFGMLGIVIEYARRRRFLRQLERAAEELESPAWVQEMVQCPTYAEGELEYEVLRRVGKAACDEVAEGRRQTDDYRDYIESWVHEAKLPLAAAIFLGRGLKNHFGPRRRLRVRGGQNAPAREQFCYLGDRARCAPAVSQP